MQIEKIASTLIRSFASSTAVQRRVTKLRNKQKAYLRREPVAVQYSSMIVRENEFSSAANNISLYWFSLKAKLLIKPLISQRIAWISDLSYDFARDFHAKSFAFTAVCLIKLLSPFVSNKQFRKIFLWFDVLCFASWLDFIFLRFLLPFLAFSLWITIFVPFDFMKAEENMK